MLKMVEKKLLLELVFGKFVSICIVIVSIIMEKFIMVVGGKYFQFLIIKKKNSNLIFFQKRLFSPEIRLLRSWITNNWLRWVQTLSTLSLIISFFAVIAALLVLRDTEEFKSSKRVLTAAILHGLAGVLMFATVILFGVKGKRRDWMMNWQFNWFGWSFQVAIIACILHLAAAFMAGYQGSNKYESIQEKKSVLI
jgi:hypothetical protein